MSLGIKKSIIENPSNVYESMFDMLKKKAVEQINEDKQELLEKRFRVVNRVRGGKIQRRKKVSAKKGYTFKAGKYSRMTARERRNRHLSQIKGARKRRSKQGRSLRKRKISMRKSKRLSRRR
tara:strand:- start:90 stop:455 length:366 start_codon:yes stop_codon:yes gene_type:complete